MIVGSQAWCDHWTRFHLQQAQKFARLKYPEDELWMWYELFRSAEWSTMEPWA